MLLETNALSMGDTYPDHPVFAALYDPLTAWIERQVFADERAALLDGVEGDVLDIGSGTGAMFSHFARVQRRREGVSLTGIEPDRHMYQRAVRTADELGLDISLRRARAESLPYDDNTFDTVVAALVLCTVEDVEESLREIARVLRPTGEFRFFEHVRGTGIRARLQSVVDPLWSRCVGGCSLTRRPHERIEHVEGLELDEATRVETKVPLVRPFIHGSARPY